MSKTCYSTAFMIWHRNIAQLLKLSDKFMGEIPSRMFQDTIHIFITNTFTSTTLNKEALHGVHYFPCRCFEALGNACYNSIQYTEVSYTKIVFCTVIFSSMSTFIYTSRCTPYSREFGFCSADALSTCFH